MKCSMILAAAAAVSPMASMADEAECAVATTAYGTELAKQMMPESECVKAKPVCPTTFQGAIDEIYAKCGGLEVAGAKWDDAAKTAVKAVVEGDVGCNCSGATAAAPVFALIAAVTAFFA
jgi:uncharacterized protein (TIGR03382 family)